MTITQTVASKLFVSFVAIAMALSLVAPAQAATEAELQAQIDQLMATITALQGQMSQGGTSVASGVCPYAWTRSLSSGSTGADVMKLQQFLNADVATRVAVSGAGSVGAETEYYGPATAAAVSKFQVMYRDSVLTPNGLVNPTGYFGPSSRAKANALCVSGSAMDDSDDSDDADDSSDDSLKGGEADVNSVVAKDEEDEIAEGDEDVAVQRIEFDVEDGDVRLERMDITLDNTGVGSGGEDDPWDAFDEISIWVDGDKVASEDTSDEDDWDDVTSGVYSFRLTGIDAIFREDDSGEVTIALSAASSVDVDGTNDEWVIYVDDSAMRFVDGLGLDIKTGAGSAAADKSEFDVVTEGSNDDLDLESSDEDPDESTLELDVDDNMEYMVFAFELSAEDSENDIDLDNLYVDVTVSGDTVAFDTPNELVKDFRLEIDGESFDAESWTQTSSSSPAVVQFDIDKDVTIEADDVVTAMLYVEFNDVTSAFSSASIVSSIQATTADIDAEGADDIGTIGGSTQTSETHTLRLAGIEFDEGGSDSASTKDSTADTAGGEQGQYVVKFDVTAFGDDLYIPTGATTATTAVVTTKGVSYAIEDEDGSQILLNATARASTTAVVTSSADKTSTWFKVRDGETETFTLTITFTPKTDGFYRAQLHAVNYKVGSTGNADVHQLVLPTGDYETDYVDIDA